MCFQNIISYQYQIPLRCLYLYWQSQLFISNQKYLISYCTVELPDTTWYSHVFTNHIEVSKVSCLQWHVSSIELNMQLRDILNHLKPTAEAAASTSVFVHLILGQNTYMCFTTLGALPKHFFGFDIPSRSGQPQLSNLTGVGWGGVITFTYLRTIDSCWRMIKASVPDQLTSCPENEQKLNDLIWTYVRTWQWRWEANVVGKALLEKTGAYLAKM